MNSKAILDSSVLIRLARLNYLSFLLKTFDEIYVTGKVKEEVLRDDKPEAEAIKDFLKNVKIVSNDFERQRNSKSSISSTLKKLSLEMLSAILLKDNLLLNLVQYPRRRKEIENSKKSHLRIIKNHIYVNTCKMRIFLVLIHYY